MRNEVFEYHSKKYRRLLARLDSASSRKERSAIKRALSMTTKELKRDYRQSRFDADDVEWITVNGAHIPLKDGIAVGGPPALKGKKFNKAKYTTSNSNNSSGGEPSSSNKSTSSVQTSKQPTSQKNAPTFRSSKEALEAFAKKDKDGKNIPVSISSFAYLNKEDRTASLQNAPDGAKISGIYSKRSGREVSVERTCSYSMPFRSYIGTTETMKTTYWTVAGDKDSCIQQTIRTILEGTNPYYEMRG